MSEARLKSVVWTFAFLGCALFWLGIAFMLSGCAHCAWYCNWFVR